MSATIQDTVEHKDKVEHKNVTLSLPEDLLRKFRVHAASRNQSMSHLMTVAIKKMIDGEDERQAAIRRSLERMRNAPDCGAVTWNRDEIYEDL